jgi:hypothetical protein
MKVILGVIGLIICLCLPDEMAKAEDSEEK